jgi:hypothetical protein
MESIVWLILGIILLAISAIIVFYVALTDKTIQFGHIYFLWILGIMGVIFILGYARHQPISTKYRKPIIEIRQELLNGKIISTDTTYKFIRKNK